MSPTPGAEICASKGQSVNEAETEVKCSRRREGTPRAPCLHWPRPTGVGFRGTPPPGTVARGSHGGNVRWGPESAERLRSFLLLLTTHHGSPGTQGLQADSACVPVTPGPLGAACDGTRLPPPAPAHLTASSSTAFSVQLPLHFPSRTPTRVLARTLPHRAPGLPTSPEVSPQALFLPPGCCTRQPPAIGPLPS